MRPVNFKYEKVGHIIMLEEDVWKRIVKFMQKNGVQVEERPTKRAVDLKPAAAVKVKRIVASNR